MNRARPEPITEEEFLELLSGYAFSALQPDELLQVEEYLHAHPEMRPRLQELEETVAQMAYAAPAVAPPFEAKARILERAGLDMQTTAVATEAPTQSPTQRQAATASSPLTRRARPPSPQQASPQSSRPRIAQPQQLFVPEENFLDRIRSWFTYAIGWKIFALGATAAVAFLAVTFFNTQELANQTTARLEALQDTVASLETELGQRDVDNQVLLSEATALQVEIGTLQSDVTTMQDQATALQTSNKELTETVSDLQTQAETLQQANETLEEQLQAQQTQFASLSNIDTVVAAAATEDGPENASGTLFLSETQGTFVLTGLDPLPEDQTYQLWVAAADQPVVSAGLVPIADGPTTTFAFAPPVPSAEITVVGLSIEPSGGSIEETPTGPIVLFTQ